MVAQARNDHSVQGAVYYVLKQGILTLQLAPGTVMSTKEMADRLHVSRTPVREAFIRLQGEELVDIIPQRETVVSRINLARVEQERFVRESLELPVIELFLQNCKPEHFAQIRQSIEEQKRCYDEKRYADFVGADNRMHQVFFEAAGQQLAWELIMNSNGHYNRIRVLTVQVEDTIVNAIRQHVRILEKMEHGDLDGVRQEMNSHVKRLNYEKADLISRYPDYFKTGDEPVGIQIGSL